MFANPTNTAPTNVRGILQHLQVVTFPGNALAANQFSGELRGYDVFAGGSGGNCVDLEHTANPYRFYGLVASGCMIGINMVHSRAEEFHGVSAFGNTIDVSLSGWNETSAYLLFDGAQFGPSDEENMYLDQQNETVLCAANCTFTKAWQSCPPTVSPTCAAIEIGPDLPSSWTLSETGQIVCQESGHLKCYGQPLSVSLSVSGDKVPGTG
ncbi:MAG: hypothetical protein ACREHV_14485 [Rhizomicrobium sp.]